MIGSECRLRVRTVALFAVILLTAWATSSWPDAAAFSSQRVLSVTAFPTAVAARGGESRITVRIPAEAAGDETKVSLSTELGAFDSASGPPAIDYKLEDVGNDLLGASVLLVGDGRAGSTVVRAQVGSLVDTVTVRFVGPTTAIRLDQPDNRARLNASGRHTIRLVATDSTGLPAPSAQISLQFVDAPDGGHAEKRHGILIDFAADHDQSERSGDRNPVVRSRRRHAQSNQWRSLPDNAIPALRRAESIAARLDH